LKGDMAAVVKEDAIVTVAADTLQVGDLVLLQTGDVVPADLRLLEAVELEVDEFEVTGEILPVPKWAQPGEEVRVFQGSLVLRGHGKGMVIAAGEESEYGQILKESDRHTRPEEIPLLGKSRFALFLLLAAGLLIGLTSYDHRPLIYIIYPLMALLLFLLVNHSWIRSILLARLQKKLLRGNILLRHGRVLEDLRKVDVFCFDKTGVLTSREIQVKEIYIAEEKSSPNHLLKAETWDLVRTGCALCHDLAYQQTAGLANPVDRALMSFAGENGINLEAFVDQYQRIYHQPFNSEKRYMTCGYDHLLSGKRIYFAKGDPEVLLKKCNRYLTPWGERKSMDFSFWDAVRGKMEEMSRDGSVIIALACSEDSLEGPPLRYMFLCLLRLENPLQPGAKAVLGGLRARGIRNVILTGDRTETALSVGVESGIENASKFYLTGRNIEQMPLSELARQCDYVSVFARISPAQKGTITGMLKRRGHGVAVVGDGTNDVIALKAADVGISFFERSSPLAKKSAKVLIGDLTDILRLMEAAHQAHRQAGAISVGITVVFLMSLFAGYLLAA